MNRKTYDVGNLNPATVHLIAHIQSLAEHDKALLARELHDELGGLMVAVAMDLSWVQAHLPEAPDPLQQRLSRARQTLTAAVDLKRKMLENLRPTLLDTFGLFAALRWHTHSRCGVAGLLCQTRFPDVEPSFDDAVSIALFRIGEGALDWALSFQTITSTALKVEMAEQSLTLQITGEGTVLSAKEYPQGDSEALDVIRHRAAAIGGHIQVDYSDAGGIELAARIPLSEVRACA